MHTQNHSLARETAVREPDNLVHDTAFPQANVVEAASSPNRESFPAKFPSITSSKSLIVSHYSIHFCYAVIAEFDVPRARNITDGCVNSSVARWLQLIADMKPRVAVFGKRVSPAVRRRLHDSDGRYFDQKRYNSPLAE